MRKSATKVPKSAKWNAVFLSGSKDNYAMHTFTQEWFYTAAELTLVGADRQSRREHGQRCMEET